MMRLLQSCIHPDLENLDGRTLHRRAARGIALTGESILLLYTEYYRDYSLPGGGVDEGEDLLQGLVRELEEETGARNIKVMQPFGLYEEYRPWYKPEYDIIHIESYCYVCRVDFELGSTRLEDYEKRNGMVPVWIDVRDAIKHNKELMASGKSKGMSIKRETFLLEQIAEELLDNPPK
jgi:ADP-ribose pyrophosphatase YjhB (NUDIX family)